MGRSCNGQMIGVQYPFANDGSGRAVHIEDAEAVSAFGCFGCREPMIARRGQKRAWHFAH